MCENHWKSDLFPIKIDRDHRDILDIGFRDLVFRVFQVPTVFPMCFEAHTPSKSSSVSQKHIPFRYKVRYCLGFAWTDLFKERIHLTSYLYRPISRGLRTKTRLTFRCRYLVTMVRFRTTAPLLRVKQTCRSCFWTFCALRNPPSVRTSLLQSRTDVDRQPFFTKR